MQKLGYNVSSHLLSVSISLKLIASLFLQRGVDLGKKGADISGSGVRLPGSLLGGHDWLSTTEEELLEDQTGDEAEHQSINDEIDSLQTEDVLGDARCGHGRGRSCAAQL